MRFRGEVEDRIGFERLKRAVHGLRVADVLDQELVFPINLLEGLGDARVGKLVNHQNVTTLTAKMPHQRRTDEAAASRAAKQASPQYKYRK